MIARNKPPVRDDTEPEITKLGPKTGKKLQAGRPYRAFSHGWAFRPVVGEAGRVATAQTAYVAASRERAGLRIITDGRDKLSAAWSRWAERQTARGLLAHRAEREMPVSDISRERARQKILEQARARAAELAKAREAALEKQAEAQRQAERSRDRGMDMGR